jgi:hypothetical protein
LFTTALPSADFRSSATERFPIEQALLQRWSKGRWTSFGGLWGYRGRTAHGLELTIQSTGVGGPSAAIVWR